MKQLLLIATALAFAVPTQLSAHCQVPCGIFDNDNVITSLMQDSTTIEKASKQIDELSKDPSANAQNITRWIMTREAHAQDIQEKMLNYFLAQRVKAPEDEAGMEEYNKQLALCHGIITTAMKCKQSTDAANITKLNELLKELQATFGSKE
ncbi:MAG: superoxide dismutase [Ni] [Luteolibacter sp.]